MPYYIKAIGILMLVLGVIIVLRPLTVKSVFNFVKVGKRIYIGGAVRIILGGLLLFAAREATIVWIPAVLGALMVLGGIAVFALGLQRSFAMIDWVLVKSDNFFRTVACVVAAVGVLLIYSV